MNSKHLPPTLSANCAGPGRSRAKVSSSKSSNLKEYPFFRHIIAKHSQEFISNDTPPSSWGVELQEMMSDCTPAEESINLRNAALRDIQTTLRRVFPTCTIYPFGSSLTELSDSPTSTNLDVFVDPFNLISGGSISPLRGKDLTLTQLREKCQKILNNRGIRERGVRVFTKVNYKPKSIPFPIIKLCYKKKLFCNLSFDNLSAVRDTELILFYMKYHPVVTPLLRMVRYWAKYFQVMNNFRGKKWLSRNSYALDLMVLLYLAEIKVIPTPWELNVWQKMEWERKKEGLYQAVVHGWDTAFSENIPEIQKIFQSTLSIQDELDSECFAQVVLHLLNGFFGFYSNIDYSTTMLCPLIGGLLPKEMFKSCGANLPMPPLLGYRLWATGLQNERQEQDSSSSEEVALTVFRIDTPLCIQDPFRHCDNISEVVNSNTLHAFIKACLYCNEVIQDNIRNKVTPHQSQYNKVQTTNNIPQPPRQIMKNPEDQRQTEQTWSQVPVGEIITEDYWKYWEIPVETEEWDVFQGCDEAFLYEDEFLRKSYWKSNFELRDNVYN